jgi:hypothetical protein
MAIRWPGGWGLYYWHGTRVPEQVIVSPETLTAQQLQTERNTEVSRAMAEKLGWARYLELMGTTLIDRWTDPKTGLGYELLDLKERRGELQPRWLRKQSSVLKDDTQPWYCEPVHPGLETAQAARKFQAMAAFVDDDEREYEELIRHCNREPELTYAFEA